MENQSTVASSWENFHDEQQYKEDEIDRVSSQTSHYCSVFTEKYLMGSGGFGQVFHAVNNFDGEDYAIKKILLTKNLKSNKIMDEIKIWAKLNNNFIVRYKSSWIENGEWNHIKDNTIMLNQRVLYIQMEMCRMTLRKAVIQINKELNQNYENGITLMGAFLSSQLFIEILEGLNYLHSQKPPVIHRDLKLTNILITDGQNGSFVKICDFGLATINKSETGNSGDVESFDINQLHTKTLGTPKYMAEEVKRGKYDTPADMYSLGVILCELFCLKIENLGNFEENLRKSFEYYPIKQIRLIRQLLQQWPSMRPNCEQVLRQKHKWSVSFDEIKFSEKFAQILYQKFNSQFRETNDKCENEEKISTEILIKKCHYAIEESFKTIYTNEKATSGVINEFRFMKNAISVNIIYIFSNIVESDVKNDMIKLILHSLYIFDNLPEMCYNIEKSLNDNYDSIWHCFASLHQQHSFSQRIINWFNCPYFIISFCNHFLENEMHILIVNTPINKSHETSQVVAYNNSLWHKNNNPQLFMELSQKAINDFDSVSKMQLFIENILKQIYPNQQIYCYIGKNELFSCHEYPTIPDIYFACRIKEFCILISSECVEKADKTLIQNEEKILKKIRRDDKNAIIDAFTPQFVYGGFVLKQFKLNDQKKCIIRINDECRYSQKNYANYKLSIYDIQILWLNNNQSEKSIEIKCGENDSKRLRRYKMTHEEIECQLETIKNIFSDINSSTELLFDSIKSCRKILSYGEFNKDNDKIRSLGLLNIAERLLNNNENNEIVIVLLQTLNYYMKTMMITDDDSIINILIPHYTKLLKSTDDNICFYTVEGFQVMLRHCDVCRQKTLESDFLTTMILLVEPIKSLDLLRTVTKTLTFLATPVNSPLSFNMIQQILISAEDLCFHTDEVIISRILGVLRNIINYGIEYKKLIRDSELLPKILQIVLNDNKELQYESIRIIYGVLMDIDDERILNPRIFNSNMYLKFIDFLICENFDIRYCSMNVLHQILFENSTQIESLFDTKLIETMINVMKDDVLIIKSLVLRVLHQIAFVSDERQLSHIYLNGIINPLSNLIFLYIEEKSTDYCFIGMSLMLIMIAKCKTHEKQIIGDIIQYRILEKIQCLKNSNDNNIAKMIDILNSLRESVVDK